MSQDVTDLSISQKISNMYEDMQEVKTDLAVIKSNGVNDRLRQAEERVTALRIQVGVLSVFVTLALLVAGPLILKGINA